MRRERPVFIQMPRQDYEKALRMEELSQQRISYQTRLRARLTYDEWASRANLGLRLRTQPERRALALLRRHLTDAQWRTLGLHGYIDVTGKVRRLGRWKCHHFRIHAYGTVYEHMRGGRMNYCIMALEPGLPECDWMLMVKLLIESDCKKFLATAKKRNWQGIELYDA